MAWLILLILTLEPLFLACSILVILPIEFFITLLLSIVQSSIVLFLFIYVIVLKFLKFELSVEVYLSMIQLLLFFYNLLLQ